VTALSLQCSELWGLLWAGLARKILKSRSGLLSVGMIATRRAIRVLRLEQVPLLQQLRIEEALFRTDNRNWCVLNRGSSPPTVVMGISGQVQALVDCEAARRRAVPVLRRYSGGGTVVTDSDTVLVSFICSRDAVPERPAYPRELVTWSERFYNPVFDRILTSSSKEATPFSLRENDYCLGDLKFGGNAQSISAQRWVHHTSFLWSFTAANLSLLTLPAKRPAYRQDRPHEAFLTPLKAHVPGGQGMVSSAGAALLHSAVEARLREVFDDVEAASLDEAEAAVARSTERQTNAYVEY
jgi:lipoate-protein ligase A